MTSNNGSSSFLGKTIDRRRFMQGVAGTALAGSVARAIPARAQSEKVIRLADDAGANFEIRTKYYFEPFTKATGIEIQHYSGQRSLAKMKAMAQTGNLEFDMSIDEGSNGLRRGAGGLPRAARPEPARYVAPDLPGMDICRDDRLAVLYRRHRLQCRDPERRPVPKNWPEFWDAAKFPGRRGLLARPQDTLEAALLADGVKPSELYPMDLDRAYRFARQDQAGREGLDRRHAEGHRVPPGEGTPVQPTRPRRGCRTPSGPVCRSNSSPTCRSLRPAICRS